MFREIRRGTGLDRKRNQKERSTDEERNFIYVNSIALCERMYIWLHTILKEKVFDGKKDVNHRLVEMFHAHTDAVSKERILTDFRKSDGTIKCLIATVAVGMGIDIPDICFVIIWGLPPTLLQLWQETGRCGRDGRECISIAYAFPRSIALHCNSCRAKGVRNCNCPSRKYLKDLVITYECQKIYCLKYFSLNPENESDLAKLKCKLPCDMSCTESC